jgi:hypothetical protein
MEKVKYTPLSVTLETVDHLIREYGTDTLALYMAYCAVAEWQKTKQVKATESFMKTRLKWGQDKFRKHKKILKEEGYIADIQKKNSDGTIQGSYIEIHYLVHTLAEPTSGLNHSMDNPTPSALDETKVLIKEKESAYKRNNTISSDELNIIEHFNSVFEKKYRITSDRKKKIKLRLKSYTVDEIKSAIDGLSKSKFHNGENDRGWVADIDFLIRNDEQIDKFLNIQTKIKETQPRFVEFDPENYVPDPL